MIGFVPTMGALHAGHVSLIRAARERGDAVVVSIFVNPTQFGPGEDYASYPRPIERDLEVCRAEGAAAVFSPSAEEMYPAMAARGGDGSGAHRALTSVHVSSLTERLCGASRPGHFDGVTLVVAKLFNIISADRAYFGQKDAQQAAVIRRMVADLNMPVEIVVCPIVREADGLAMSSRNAYLSESQRKQARSIFAGLKRAKASVEAGERRVDALRSVVRDTILSAGPCEIDYVEIVDPETLEPRSEFASPSFIAVAVRIGPARLIDNVVL